MGVRGRREPKRKSKYGPPMKPAWEKASRFVGVKMTPGTFSKLTALVKLAGKTAESTQSSVIVGLIDAAWSGGDPLAQTKKEPLPALTSSNAAPNEVPPVIVPASKEERDAAIAAAGEAISNAKGKVEWKRAWDAREALLAAFRPPDPPFGRKS